MHGELRIDQHHRSRQQVETGERSGSHDAKSLAKRSKNRANGWSRRPKVEPLFRVAQLSPQAGHVVLVELDLLLIGLKSLEHPLIVALAAQPDSFLFGELLPRLVEQFLFAGEFLFEYLAPVGVALALEFGFDLGK